MTEIDNNTPFRLGEWWVEPQTNRIKNPSGSSVIEHRIMELLVYLASRPGEVVSSDEIHSQVWRNVVVGDHSIYQSIATLRKVLKDNATQPSYIETIPKKGYRLIAKVEVTGFGNPDHLISNTADSPNATHANNEIQKSGGDKLGDAGFTPFRWMASHRWKLLSFIVAVGVLVNGVLVRPFFDTPSQYGTSEIKSIAVLPFVNVTGNEDNNYLALGLAEEILNALAREPELKVVARTSSFNLQNETDIREIGKKLNVDAVLEGSVRVANKKYRISVQLIDTADGFHIWSNTYDFDSEDIFRIQESTADSVLSTLNMNSERFFGIDNVQFSTQDMEAHDLYLLGLHYLHERNAKSIQKAIEFNQQAIAIDENYALAYAALAKAYLLSSLYGDISTEQAIFLAQPAIAKAQKIDNKLANIHISLGLIKLFERQYTEAEQEYKIALELSPSNAYAYLRLGVVTAIQGRINQAKKYYEQALRLDPLNVEINSNLAYTLTRMGRYNEAAEHLLEILHNRPDDVSIILENAETAHYIGKLDIALHFARDALRLNPNSSYAMALIAQISIDSGRLEEASSWLVRAKEVQKGFLPILMKAQAKLYMTKGEYHRFDLLMSALANSKPIASPSLFASSRWDQDGFTGIAKLLIKDYSEAIKYFEASLKNSENLSGSLENDIFYRGSLAYAYRQLGEETKCQSAIAKLKVIIEKAHQQGWDSNELKYEEARLSILDAQADMALRILEKSVNHGNSVYWWMTIDPLMESLKTNPSFEEFVIQIRKRLQQSAARVENPPVLISEKPQG